MDRDQQHDLLPLDGMSHQFDVVIRGYDRGQVHDVLDRMEGELRVAMADREASSARSAELASQLSNVQAEMESLRRKADQAGEPSFANMGTRISNMLSLAEEEATDIRRQAQEEADKSRTDSESTSTETARIREEAQEEARRIIEQSQAKATELKDSARKAVEDSESTSKARVAKIEEDFDLAQKARRAEAVRVEQERDQASRRDAQMRVEQAQAKSAQLIEAATAQVGTLQGQQREIHERLSTVRELLSGLPDLTQNAGGPVPQPGGGARPDGQGPAQRAAPGSAKAKAGSDSPAATGAPGPATATDTAAQQRPTQPVPTAQTGSSPAQDANRAQPHQQDQGKPREASATQVIPIVRRG